MSISEICQQALVAFGVLYNGNVPAGTELISKSEIRINIVDGTYDRDRASKIFANIWSDNGAVETRDKDKKILLEHEVIANFEAIFTEEQKKQIINGIGYWFNDEVNVKLVSEDDQPDLTIFAREGGGGFAFVPPNTHPEFQRERVMPTHLFFYRLRLGCRASLIW